MKIFVRSCYAVAAGLLAFVVGLAGYGGMDAVREQGWLVVLVIVFAASGLIVDIDQHEERSAAASIGGVVAGQSGTSSVRQTRMDDARPTARISVPGVTHHGRMRASLNMKTREHRVTWAANMKVAGTLRPGAKDGWDVYDVDDELIDWAPDLRSGMEMLEDTAE